MSEFETRAVHCGRDLRKLQNEFSIAFQTHKDEEGLVDSNKQRLEECIASLEHAKYGICFPSGTAAVTSISGILDHGDHVIVLDKVYHGTRTLLSTRAKLNQIQVTFVDLREADALKDHLKGNTRMVWIETPCNPTMSIIDIAAVSEIVKQYSKAFLVVDNTFMTPYCQNPLLLGADITMHSLTKFMNGHSDVLMGAAATNDENLYNKLRDITKSTGASPSSFDCSLVLRGLRTLHVRMDRHVKNAMKIARFLEHHPKVEEVLYPGLESHPGHALCKRQCRGFGGMVSFRLRGGTKEAGNFGKAVRLFTLAVSLGCTESLLDVSSLMTARPLTKECREQLGITDNLIRLSTGLEDAEELIMDLDQALNQA